MIGYWPLANITYTIGRYRLSLNVTMKKYRSYKIIHKNYSVDERPCIRNLILSENQQVRIYLAICLMF